MTLFDELCDAPTDEQRARLIPLRAEDPALATELGRMLEADRAPDHPLDVTGGAAALAIGFEGVVLGGRWRLRHRLGAGGGGEVWLADDALEGAEVALKLIDANLMGSARQVRRFRREFRALSRIDHEGCLRVLAEGVVGAVEGDSTNELGGGPRHALAEVPVGLVGRRFLVMEYAPGGDLTRLVRAPDEVLLPVLLQLANALDHIHRQQLVHRDIKPSNVLLTSDDPPRVKLADFGIVKLTEATGTSVTGDALVGTPDYLSPEQVRGEPADPRSDLYALGCLIHALWAGEVPFGGTSMRRLWARVSERAPPLATRAPWAPAGLCALADSLLSVAPEDRPQSAKAVARTLETILAALSHATRPPTDRSLRPVGFGAFLYPPGLIGRDHVVSSILAEGARVKTDGRCALVALFGAAGLGKTTLAQAVLRRLTDEGWRSLALESSSELRRAPFSPFTEFDAQLARLRESPGAERAPAPPNEAGVRPEQVTALAQRRLAASIASSLKAIAAEGPTCVLLEDLHEASAGASALLRELVRELKAQETPVLLLATLRPQTHERLDALSIGRAVTLEPLNDDDAVRVIARILGTSPGELADELTRPLVEEAQGNPLLLRTAVRNLAEAGGLRRDADGWMLRPEASPREAVTTLLGQRLATLSAHTRTVLTVAAVIGDRFDADLLAASCRIDEDALLDALVDGIRAAVIAPESKNKTKLDSYRFDHARLRELLLSQVAPHRLGELHDTVGFAMQSRGASVASLAHHFGQGRDPDRALEHLGAAVAEARAAHDQGVVADLLGRMVARLDELGPEVAAERRRALIEQRADALVWSGDYAEGARLLQALEEEAVDNLDRGRILRKRGLALLRTAEPGRGLVALEGAVTLLGDRTPRSRFGRLARLSWDFVAVLLGRLLPARRHAARRHERASAHRELALMYRWVDLYDSAAHLARFYRLTGQRAPTEYQVDANAMAAMLFALRSMPNAGAYVREKARELASSSGDLVGLARLTIIQGACEAMLDDSTTALARMDEGVSLARQTGDRWLLCFALSSRAWIRGLVGSAPEAHREFEEAAALAREIGAAWLEADAMSGGMLAGLVIGRIGESERTARTLLGSDVRLSFPVFEQLAVEGMAGVHFLSGRFDSALAGYQRAHDLLVRHRLDEGWGWLIPMELIEAACCLADQNGGASLPDLDKHLKRGRRAMRRMDRLPLYQGCVTIAKGVTASRRNQVDKANGYFDKAVADRGASRRSYIDTWIAVRPALERLHLGAPRDQVEAELGAVDASYEALGLEGLRGWLDLVARMKGISPRR